MTSVCALMAACGAPQDLAGDVYAELMAHRRGDPNDHALACIHATWVTGAGALPDWLGLTPGAYLRMRGWHFPGVRLAKPVGRRAPADCARVPERADLRKLLLEHRAGQNQSEEWIADIVVAGCMGSDHLWQDLGLWSRRDLSALLVRNFPSLVAKNERDMKWKKFLYKQLCAQEGIYICRAPSCEVCADYAACFGSEEPTLRSDPAISAHNRMTNPRRTPARATRCSQRSGKP